MVPITPQLLIAATDIKPSTAHSIARHMQESCRHYRINESPKRLADYLAHLGHESNGFRSFSENLTYTSLERLRKVFGRRIPQDDREANKLLHNPAGLANLVYGGRLGNVLAGDGYKYRGRGLIQCTGKANYQAVAESLQAACIGCPDFVVDPDAMSEPKWAAWSAAVWWADKHLNALADAGDFLKQTIRINGGQNGWDDRKARRARSRSALQVTA